MNGSRGWLILFFACLLLSIASSTRSYADCAPGYGKCPSGGCAPLGSVCCNDGKHWCNQGTICERGTDFCIKKSSPRVCSNGTSYCDKESVCITGNKCLSIESPRYCGGGKYCNEGFACITGNKCLAMTSPRYCGGGRFCEEGYECAGDNKCRSTASSGGSGLGSGGGSGDRGKPPPVADGCLVVEPSREVTALGRCTKQDGTKSHWFFTKVRSSGVGGCPKSIEFDYLDSDDGSVQSYFTPFDVQICGGEPLAVEVKK
jgi:hypothetical protein